MNLEEIPISAGPDQEPQHPPNRICFGLDRWVRFSPIANDDLRIRMESALEQLMGQQFYKPGMIVASSLLL